MNTFLTASAFIVLIAAAAYVIHRLNIEHADRIAVHRYSAPLPGRHGRGTPPTPGRSRPVQVANLRRATGPPRRGPWPLPTAPPTQPYHSPQVTSRFPSPGPESASGGRGP